MASFIENLRQSRSDKKILDDEINAFNASIKDLSKTYAKSRGIKQSEAEAKIRDFVRYAGESEGVLTGDSADGDIATYGNKLFSDMNVSDMNMGFNDYIARYGSAEQKAAFNELQKDATKETSPQGGAALLALPGGALGAGIAAAPFTGGASIPIGALAALGIEGGELLGYATQKGQKAKREKILNDADPIYAKTKEMAAEEVYDMLDNYKEYVGGKAKNNGGSDSTSDSDSGSNSDTITFVLPRANDPNYRGFGQKIVDLGIATDHGLWGEDGDVNFYTQQLYDQGALDSRGNLKIGVPITLRKRKNRNR